MLFANSGTRPIAAQPLPTGKLPQIAIDPSPGVQAQLDQATAEQIAYGADPARNRRERRNGAHPPRARHRPVPPTAVAKVAGATYRLRQDVVGGVDARLQAGHAVHSHGRSATRSADAKLVDVAKSVGLEFKQGSFRFGVSNDTKAMMGGGVCWLDYNSDGRLDLFAVNSYASADALAMEAQRRAAHERAVRERGAAASGT